MADVWTDSGQAHTTLCEDPATRAAQTTTYYGHWGSAATARAVTMNALGAANAEARVACTVSKPAAHILRYVFTITATGLRIVNEWGVFDALTGGNMLCSGTLATLNIETGDRAEFTIDRALKDQSE